MPITSPERPTASRPPLRRASRVALLSTVGLIAVAGTGCGSGGTSGAATTEGSGGSTKAAARDKAVRFSECVRRNGVADFPDPDAKGEYEYGVSVSAAVFTKAVKACKALQPPGSLSSRRTPKQQAASLRFAACIRDHGVQDFPDPVNGEPVVNTYKIPSSNTPNGMTVLNAAMHACSSVAAQGAGGQR